MHRVRCLSSKNPGPIVWSDPSAWTLQKLNMNTSIIHFHPFPTFQPQKHQFLCFVFWTGLKYEKEWHHPCCKCLLWFHFWNTSFAVSDELWCLCWLFRQTGTSFDGKQRKARKAVHLQISQHMCQTHLVERLTQVTRFDGFSMPKGHTIIESLWSSFEQKIDWWILTTNLKTDSWLVDQGASKQQEEVMQWIVALTNQRPALLRWVHCRNVEVWATANQIRCGATRQTFSALARA